MNDTANLHDLPEDMSALLDTDTAVRDNWQSLTPLAKNEWICWVTHVKQESTRKQHLVRFYADMKAGKRRPCCWPGCPHRNPNAKKWFK